MGGCFCNPCALPLTEEVFEWRVLESFLGSWRRGGSRHPLEQPSSTQRGPTRKLEKDFLPGHVVDKG